MIHRLRLGLVPAFLLLCLLFGGASAAGWWSNLGLQVGGLLLLFYAAATRRTTPLSPASRQAIGIAALLVTLILLQLVPLPPGLWTALPGRAPVAEGFRLLGLPLPWLAISLEPYKTVASAVWLLPAFAVLFGIVVLGAYRSNWMAWVLAALSIASVLVGALQLAGGDRAPAYVYAITNNGAMTGFFANANHLATLLLATIPFLAALYLDAINKGRSLRPSRSCRSPSWASTCGSRANSEPSMRSEAPSHSSPNPSPRGGGERALPPPSLGRAGVGVAPSFNHPHA